ncbi:MAG: TraR/DksA family transcriptional regulator [Planctomycetes bacterium]|nr:TraR/DksA family transcriptional regulator [Planctomycetota bacterium]
MKKAGKKNPGKSSVPPGTARRTGFLAEMKKILLVKRSELDDRISEKIKEHLAFSSQRSADTTDIAADALDDELALLVAEAETKERGQIDEALGKVAAGTYGTCEGCGKTIPVARLKALPFAALCVNCKQMEEKLGPNFLGVADNEESDSEISDHADEEPAAG